ncbi:MAG: prepilin-type N-terminal cleavage/methylation domain-containing protein [Aquificae bacterium]|nr:prepilin-type N-terminal cleavage/methylation domain-containing protein [Aquificota bacterium]
MKKIIYGFTLIELIIVLAILAILTAVAVPTYSKIKMSSYKSTVKSDVRNLVSRMVMLAIEINNIPSLSPNPCSNTCSLVFGSYSESFNISQGVNLEIQNTLCSDGSSGFRVIGTHDRVPSWTYQYDYCTNQFLES